MSIESREGAPQVSSLLASVQPLVAARCWTEVGEVLVTCGLPGQPAAYGGQLQRAAVGRWLAWVASMLLERLPASLASRQPMVACFGGLLWAAGWLGWPACCWNCFGDLRPPLSAGSLRWPASAGCYGELAAMGG
jgi:hypothetical protein